MSLSKSSKDSDKGLTVPKFDHGSTDSKGEKWRKWLTLLSSAFGPSHMCLIMKIFGEHLSSIFCGFLIFLCTFFAFFASSDRRLRYIRYRDNIGYPRYGESYNIGDNQYFKKLIVLPNKQILGIGSIPYHKKSQS